MNLKYDPDLIEAVVDHALESPPSWIPKLQTARFRASRDQIYHLLDLDDRQIAFRKFYFEWFCEWEFDQQLLVCLKKFPLFANRLNELILRKALKRSEEGAELFVQDDNHRHSVISVNPQRFLGAEPFERFLMHELTHVHDMIDPSFGYEPFQDATRFTPTQQQMIRDRYRVLWDITIDGRLNGESDRMQMRRAEFDRAFEFLHEKDQVFEKLWKEKSPRHCELIHLAIDPRELEQVDEPMQGKACPLCRFPTFEWANLKRVSPLALKKIHREFPSWQERQGACSRCVEIYEGSAMELPAPLWTST